MLSHEENSVWPQYSLYGLIAGFLQFFFLHKIDPLATDTCEDFGKTMDYGKDAEMKTNGVYVWGLWRFYSVCRDGIGKYVGKTFA